MLRGAGFDAHTVEDENIAGSDDVVVFQFSQSEERTLITLDLDFSNLQAYPYGTHAGIVIVRTKRQDKLTLIAILQRLIPIFRERSAEQQLWIVENDRIRVRE